MELWEQCLETRLDPDVKGRIIGVKTQMTKFDLLFGLQLCERILCITDNLSKTLQKQSLSAAEGQHLAGLTVLTLKGMRNEEMFFESLNKVIERIGVDGPALPRKRNAPIRYDDGNGQSYHSPTVEEHYQVKYFEVIDLARINSIQYRFDQPGYRIYRNLEAVLLNAANQKDYSIELSEVVSFYKDDDLQGQLQIFATSINAQSDHKPFTLQDTLTYLRSLSSVQRDFFSQMLLLARLIHLIPATNAVSERSFSTMRRIKSYLRSTMLQPRLNYLMILNIYKEQLDDVDLSSIANEFVCGSEHRMHVFGKF